MHPLMNGLEVTRRLRRQSIQTPILLLTARDAPEEVVRGLDSGADDYLTKPFSFDVLLARIRVRTRAASGPWTALAVCGPRPSISGRGKPREASGTSRSHAQSFRFWSASCAPRARCTVCAYAGVSCRRQDRMDVIIRSGAPPSD